MHCGGLNWAPWWSGYNDYNDYYDYNDYNEYNDYNYSDLDVDLGRFSDLVTQFTITEKLQTLKSWHILRVSDLQSDSDLDSIHNSCDVFKWNEGTPNQLMHFVEVLLTQFASKGWVHVSSYTNH